MCFSVKSLWIRRRSSSSKSSSHLEQYSCSGSDSLCLFISSTDMKRRGQSSKVQGTFLLAAYPDILRQWLLDRKVCKKKRLEKVREMRKLRGERQQLKDTGLDSLAAGSGESEDEARNRDVEVFLQKGHQSLSPDHT